MKVYEATLDDRLLETLIALSADWENENSCYGYRKNDKSDIEGSRIFLAEENGETIGYLLASRQIAQNSRSIMPDDTPYLEIDELYVVPQFRSCGVGRALYRLAEKTAANEGMEYVMLSTATKNFRRILHFYIDEMGMEFWSARLFKRIIKENVR